MTAIRYKPMGCDCATCERLPFDQPLTSAQFQEWLAAHPLDPVEQENVEASVQRVKKRLREKPGPDLNL